MAGKQADSGVVGASRGDSTSGRHSERDGASTLSETNASFPSGNRENAVPRGSRNKPKNGGDGARATMVGATTENGEDEELDERPFNQEKVVRVPTKAQLKPPKGPHSLIADPQGTDEDEDESTKG